MSAEDPISPVSPFDLSPTSPRQLPTQPRLAPIIGLPRLSTNFTPSADLRSPLKCLSTQSPSPLCLSSAFPSASDILLQGSRATSLSPSTKVSLAITTAVSDLSVHTTRVDTDRSMDIDTETKIDTPQRTHSPAQKSPGLFDDHSTSTSHSSPAINRVFQLPMRPTPGNAMSPLSAISSAMDLDTLTSPRQSDPKTPVVTRKSALLPYPIITQSRVGATSRLSHQHTPAITYPFTSHHSTGSNTTTARRLALKCSTTTTSPPKLYIQIQTPATQNLHHRLTHLSRPLIPLISVTTGLPHPSFPRSILQYHLLTHAQLDDLARHYHQVLDGGEHRWRYPMPLGIGKVWCGFDGSVSSAHGSSCSDQTGHASVSVSAAKSTREGKRVKAREAWVPLSVKRRRFGRFIGLRGCESPVVANVQRTEEGASGRAGENVTERMEREYTEGMRRRREMDEVREKMWGRHG